VVLLGSGTIGLNSKNLPVLIAAGEGKTSQPFFAP
jgi:hypothetical protein